MKEPDYAAALQAVRVVSEQSSPPVRYYVNALQNNNIVAFTMTRYTAQLLAYSLAQELGCAYQVRDMEGRVTDNINRTSELPVWDNSDGLNNC